MIKPSKILRSYIEGFETRRDFCERFGIDQAILSRYLSGSQTCSSNFIASVIRETGMDFEKAFEVDDE